MSGEVQSAEDAGGPACEMCGGVDCDCCQECCGTGYLEDGGCGGGCDFCRPFPMCSGCGGKGKVRK
jgi:hypothetical protein